MNQAQLGVQTTPIINVIPKIHEIADMKMIPGKAYFFKSLSGELQKIVILNMNGYNPSLKDFFLCIYDNNKLKNVKKIKAETNFNFDWHQTRFENFHWTITNTINKNITNKDYIYLTILYQD